MPQIYHYKEGTNLLSTILGQKEIWSPEKQIKRLQKFKIYWSERMEYGL